MLRPTAPLLTELVRLDKSAALMMIRPASYEEWKAWADELLKRRGPKW